MLPPTATYFRVYRDFESLPTISFQIAALQGPGIGHKRFRKAREATFATGRGLAFGKSAVER
jgi:hypothetical protein